MLKFLLTIAMLAALVLPKVHVTALSSASLNEPGPDQSTVTLGPIPTQFLTVSGSAKTLDLSTYVTGMVGTPMFSATSSNTAMVTVSVSASELTITPVLEGQAQITVSLGSTTSTAFTVTVLPDSPWSVSDDDVYLLEGNVGIGVEDPDERLVVDGRIKAEEIHVEDVTPADYVFEEDYELLSLDELKEHIQTHGHLPGIASGAEMEANGVSVSRMQTMLLEKVEELMLYTIDQHRTLASQKRFIDEQERRIAAQHQYIGTLEKRLSKLERGR